ncbi:MAG: 1,4-dihydroxy-2-naphthoate octaprenyltransferase [Rhodospirillaceae bacterium]|nr:1,4-dihydroxy-2-naphthoate octaprenyltransferase [Rhodospirillales bacterium]
MGVTHLDQPPTGWRLWLAAVRPRTLTIAVAPVMVGAGLAFSVSHTLHVLPLAATLLGAVLIQAGTNLWNDVSDALRGGDQPMRQGPPRVTALGWATPERVRRAALVSFAAAALVGLYLAMLGGWPVVGLGLASLAAGWAYSGGPKPISYTALGEMFVLAFFGMGAVAGTVWLQLHGLPPQVWPLGLAMGLPAAAVLMANNYRDMEADRLVGRRTLAIRLGPAGSKAVYAILVVAPFAMLDWLALAAVPLAVKLVWDFSTTPRGPAFNGILAATARFQLVLAALVVGGLAYAAY